MSDDAKQRENEAFAAWTPEVSPANKTHYFDRKPCDAISAQDVRKLRKVFELHAEFDPSEAYASFAHRVFLRLLDHPGVSSTARAVIEAAL
jgi:hypothetical protein